MLLHWGTLEPLGSSSLAAVRFSGPVRIRAIRIHPRSTRLFSQNTEVVSETDPEAFTLSIFLNAQPAPTVQEPKPKGTNVLVPTKLAYAGGLREFPLDMGDFVTRLMVIQGGFTRVTIAVYGDVISEPPLFPLFYEAGPLPTMARHPMSTVLDPSNAADPTLLSRQFLSLTSDAPSLPLAIRFMCCIKAPDGEWDPERVSYADLTDFLEVDTAGLDRLEKALDALATPVHENIDHAVLKSFVSKTYEALSDKTNDHLYVMAGILRCVAAQPVIVVHTFLESLDLADLLEVDLLDKHVLDRLRDAAANHVIARALRAAPILKILRALQDPVTVNHSLKDAAASLLQRVIGWERFEKALSTTVPDLVAVAGWIKEIASEETTLGVFLLSVIEDDTLVSKLERCTVQEQPAPPPALWDSTGLVSSSEFASFVRAFMGVSCVVAVLFWSDNVTHASCTERILAVLRLWQEVDGYREIVNQLFLMPRSTYRLEGVLKNSTPSRPSPTGIQVEQILMSLFMQPSTMIRPELGSIVKALPTPPLFISEEERQEMVGISLIAKGGLTEALKILLSWSDQPLDTSSCRTLQVALLILENALEDREAGEWRIMRTAWQDGLHGLVYRLVELFQQLVTPIQGQFLLKPPLPLQPFVLAQLLSSSNATMRILSRLLPAHPLPRRMTRTLTHHIATLFIATDAVDCRYSQGDAVRKMARAARPTCAEALSVLSSLLDESDPDHFCGELVLRTLLHVALYPESDDPVARLEQVGWLLDLVLPLAASGDRTEQRFWTRRVVPNVLPELQHFVRALAVDHRVSLVKRLAELDHGEVGLGQWFVNEELKDLFPAAEILTVSQLHGDKQTIAQARVTNSLQFLSGFIEADASGDALEFFRQRQTLHTISHIWTALLESSTNTSCVVDFASLLAPNAALMEPQARLDLAIILLRGVRYRPSAMLHAATILTLLERADAKGPVRVARELGPALRLLVEEEHSQSRWQEEPFAQAIVSCLSWLVSQPRLEALLLPGIEETLFNEILEGLEAFAPHDEKLLSDFRTSFVFPEDVVMESASSEDGALTISMDRLAELLTHRPATPTTPRLSGESIFKMATLSPIAALVGTSRISTLTKTYQNNDFRQLSVRQNTSRQPSMHVDDFEQGPGPSSPVTIRQSPPAPMIAEYLHLLPPTLESE